MTTPQVDEVAKAAIERVHTRLARLNRLTFLAQWFTPDELEGLIRLAEAGAVSRGSLAKIDHDSVAVSALANIERTAIGTETEEQCGDCGEVILGAHGHCLAADRGDETIEW